MGTITPKPYRVKNKDGTWRWVTPQPKEYVSKKVAGAPKMKPMLLGKKNVQYEVESK